MEVYMESNVEVSIIKVLQHEWETGIGGMFRRRRSPCPSGASNLAPSLVSPPLPWVWPKV